jgi:adenylyltransferase/sulfurtransferase
LLGTIQATEAIKRLLGIGEPLIGRLLLVDALTMRTQEIAIARDPACPACGTRTLTALADYESWCGVEAVVPSAQEVTPSAFAAERASGTKQAVLVDVREPWEVAIASLPGAVVIPLGEFAERGLALPPEMEIVVMCHHGVRSAQAAAFLRGRGFARVRNLAGGIDRWSIVVDPGVARY